MDASAVCPRTLAFRIAPEAPIVSRVSASRETETGNVLDFRASTIDVACTTRIGRGAGETRPVGRFFRPKIISQAADYKQLSSFVAGSAFA